MVVTRKLAKCSFTVRTEFDAVIRGLKHFSNHLRYHWVIFNMQDRQRHGIQCPLMSGGSFFMFLGLYYVASPLAHFRSRVEQLLMPPIDQRNETLMMLETKQMCGFSD